MAFKPTPCPDCQYPPNFILASLAKEDFDDDLDRIDIRCRDCGDHWVEVVEDAK